MGVYIVPPPQLSEEPEDEDWLATYADAITLLMAFFVLMLSFSKIDLPTFDAVMAGLKKEIGMGEGTGKTVVQEVSAALET
ncbi:MAG: flagellar motor protein MotB, partial [Magnetovibrio sp.]|nr:flagellar motor protein MotB [Magnetovibrio sp.]